MIHYNQCMSNKIKLDSPVSCCIIATAHLVQGLRLVPDDVMFEGI